MIRNRNGYWMDPRFMDADSGAGTGGAESAGAETAGGNAPQSAENAPEQAGGSEPEELGTEALNAEIARLKAEMAKQKTALDAATSEAGKYRKELKSKMTQEQIDAEEKAEAAERTAKELEDLRKEVAKGKTVKNVMGKLGLDEDAAGNLADHLYGAADIENALLEIQKAWQSREKALRLEFGKIPGPGAGADSNSPEAQAVRRAAEIGRNRKAQNDQAQKAMDAYIR